MNLSAGRLAPNYRVFPVRVSNLGARCWGDARIREITIKRPCPPLENAGLQEVEDILNIPREPILWGSQRSAGHTDRRNRRKKVIEKERMEEREKEEVVELNRRAGLEGEKAIRNGVE